jgi:uncharacterized surface protein with fasciclin (FAS1) repeats
VLEGTGPYTVFAEPNRIQTLKVGGLAPKEPAKTLEEQLQAADKNQFSEILKQYVLEGSMPLDQLVEQELRHSRGRSSILLRRKAACW